MDCYWRVLGHETYPASSPSVRIIKVISEANSIQKIFNGKISNLNVYFSRPQELHDLKYT